MKSKKSDDLVSLEMLYTNLTTEESKKLVISIREIAKKHGVEVQIETRKSQE